MSEAEQQRKGIQEIHFHVHESRYLVKWCIGAVALFEVHLVYQETFEASI